MRETSEIRGDYFVDRLGGWFEAALALVSCGIVATRFRDGFLTSNFVLALLYLLEVVGAIAITRSKLAPMRVAFWVFTFRVLAGIAMMSVVHGDKLARSTLGFPLIVAIYCWCRIRALQANP